MRRRPCSFAAQMHAHQLPGDLGDCGSIAGPCKSEQRIFNTRRPIIWMSQETDRSQIDSSTIATGWSHINLQGGHFELCDTWGHSTT